jgi:ATP-dependent protease Clp ATPase subunit
MSSENANTALSCKFCRKSQADVVALLAFPEGLNICDECVWLMVEIIATGRPQWRDRIVDKLRNVGSGPAQT